jgi:predicted RNA binding protein YcfA (HicA-like mRNA interferase family)
MKSWREAAAQCQWAEPCAGAGAQLGYREVNRVGSHIILQTDSPGHHRVSVPNHDPLRVGTLNAILRSVAKAKLVSREDLIASL